MKWLLFSIKPTKHVILLAFVVVKFELLNEMVCSNILLQAKNTRMLPVSLLINVKYLHFFRKAINLDAFKRALSHVQM